MRCAPGTSPERRSPFHTAMSSLSRRVHRTIQQRRLVAEGDRVAVAISGGPDSVALTLALCDLAVDAPWQLAGLIHVNHCLRAEASDADELFCREFADRTGLPIDVSRVDVRQRMATEGESLEAAARAERYRAFDEAADRLGATLVATGHTRDDQAETVLLRLFRGAGSRGISGIRARRGRYVRPLIDCRRLDIEAELGHRNQPAVADHSNLDLDIPRNRLRHTILPAITAHWPGAVSALARFAELAGDDEEFLTTTAAEVAPAMTLSGPGGVQVSGGAKVQVLDARGVSQLPDALARRVVRSSIEAAGGKPSLREVDAVRRLARSGKPRGHLDLDGIWVERDGARLTFGAWPAAEAASEPFVYELPVPGSVRIAETGVSILASLTTGTDTPDMPGDTSPVAFIQAARVRPPLIVRNRRPGDRLRPFGAPGTRKLQDLLVDRKVPRSERDAVPLVVDREGRILWVAGVTIAEECRVTRPLAGVVVLEIKKGNQ